jgi:ferrous iron transport protein B
MIGAFVPERPVVGGLLGLQGLTLFLMYMLGIAVALRTALILKKTLFRGEPPPFVLELPTYKKPQLRTTTLKVYFQGREFLYRAGTTIFAVAVIVWALAYFPHVQSITDQFEVSRQALTDSGMDAAALEEALDALGKEEGSAHLENSYLGRMGHGIEAFVAPLGWDWRIGTAVVASFPAREIIVATLGIIFNMGDEADETSLGLREALQQATSSSGEPLFNVPVALSVMVFFALCMQCAATLVMIRRETATWRWPVYTFSYMTVLAYVGAAATYHLTTWLGWGGV